MSTLRSDGRTHGELRELKIFYQGLGRTDGSASFAFGDTRAIASVSGPIEVRLASEQASRATFEVTVRPVSGISGTESKSISSTIRSLLTPSLILTQNPRALIQLVIQSLSPLHAGRFQPSLIASLINVSTLALLNASSVPMRGVVCAVSIGRLRAQNTSSTTLRQILVVDPSENEMGFLEGGGCFAFMFGTGILVSSANQATQIPDCEQVWSKWQATSSRFDENELVEASKLARTAVRRVWQEMKESVERMGAPFSEWKSTVREGDLQEMELNDEDQKMET